MANPYRNTGKAGSPAHFIGPIGKGVMKIAKAFGNTAKQYYKKITKPKKTSNFKPFHRDGKVYDTDMINKAFEKRFGTPSKPTDIMGRPQAVPANPKNVISNATVDRASKMRNIERGYIGKTPRFAKPPVKK